MTSRKWIIIVVAGVLLPVVGKYITTPAGPIEAANAAYDRQDYLTAMKILRPLADQGNEIAQENIGTIYMEGKGVERNYTEAMKWYRKAVEHNDIDAPPLVNIGMMYHEGWGVKKDYAEAMKWYRRAADKGDAVAQGNIGMMYEQGEGVPQDNVQAYMWYSLARADNINTISTKMTPAQIAEAKRLASQWKPASTVSIDSGWKVLPDSTAKQN